MKIVTLDSNMTRTWFRNQPVLVYSDTGEAVLVDGKPRNPTRDEVVAILKAIKKKKTFDVEVDGKPTHFVNGREFLKRTFVRIHKQPVQLRMGTGQVLGMARPKFVGHDLENSDVQPIDGRPCRQVKLDVPVSTMPMAVVGAQRQPIPHPDDCPECKEYSKPLGCREDEHHFVCRYHDAWEGVRRSQQMAQTIAPAPAPSAGTISIIDLNTGMPMREAAASEIAEAKRLIAAGELPIITIGEQQYAVGDENLALPEGIAP